MLSNNENNTFPESCYLKDYENIKLANLSSFWAAHFSLLFEMTSKMPIGGIDE